MKTVYPVYKAGAGGNHMWTYQEKCYDMGKRPLDSAYVLIHISDSIVSFHY